MKHRKAQHTEKDFTPIITDDKVFLLRYNFITRFIIDNEKNVKIMKG